METTLGVTENRPLLFEGNWEFLISPLSLQYQITREIDPRAQRLSELKIMLTDEPELYETLVRYIGVDGRVYKSPEAAEASYNKSQPQLV